MFNFFEKNEDVEFTQETKNIAQSTTLGRGITSIESARNELF